VLYWDAVTSLLGSRTFMKVFSSIDGC